MNIELKRKKEELEKKLRQLKKECSLIEKFVIKNKKYYRNKESILAIKQIISIFKDKIEQEVKLENELFEISLELEKTCNHEIIISDEYNYFCAICKTLIINVPDTTVLLIENPDSDYSILIDGIINKGLEENNLMDYAINQLEELQYSTGIKIKRLLK